MMSSGLLLVAVFMVFTISCRAQTEVALDPANATYIIEGRSIALTGGSAEQPAAPGSASKLATRLGEKQVTGDLNGDGRPDVAVSLVHSGGGSGTFYYVAVLLNEGSGKSKATNAELLGDRIALEGLKLSDTQITVDYLTRQEGEAMATLPSVKATKTLKVQDGRLIEVR